MSHILLPKHRPKGLSIHVDRYCDVVSGIFECLSHKGTWEGSYPWTSININSDTEKVKAAARQILPRLRQRFINNISAEASLETLEFELNKVEGRPSALQYLSCSSSQRFQLSGPAKPTLHLIDMEAISAFMIARNGDYPSAITILDSVLDQLSSRYGPDSMQVGIAIAELAHCWNMLGNYDRAEDLIRRLLYSEVDHGIEIEKPLRRDRAYLLTVLADSQTGNARYSDAIATVERITRNYDVHDTFFMINSVRLSRAHRRMKITRSSSLRDGAPLSQCSSILSKVPRALQNEFIMEVTCNLRAISVDEKREDKASSAEGISRNIEKCIGQSLPAESPSLTWFQEVTRQLNQSSLSPGYQRLSYSSCVSTPNSEDPEVDTENPRRSPMDESPSAPTRPSPQPLDENEQEVQDDKRDYEQALLDRFKTRFLTYRFPHPARIYHRWLLRPPLDQCLHPSVLCPSHP